MNNGTAYRIPRAGCATIVVGLVVHLRGAALDAARASTLGHLVLGRGFDPRDLAAYAAGVALAALLESAIRNLTRSPPRVPEPGRQRFREPVCRSVAHPGDIAVRTDQHRGRRSDLAEHRQLPSTSKCRVHALNAL